MKAFAKFRTLPRFALAFLLVVSGAASSTRAADATAASKSIPTLYLIGDSTVKNGKDKGDGGLWGWGNPLPAFFDQSRIRIQNRALGGTSSRSFRVRGLWDKVLADLKPGDFVIMQFGHNDGGALDDAKGRGSIRGNGDESKEIKNGEGKDEVVHSYGWYLRQNIAEAKGKGATVIVCSLIPRNDWSDGKVHRAMNGYGRWAQEAAAQGDGCFIDLNGIIADRYDKIGQEKVGKDFFVTEHTHTSLAGARLNAECVAEGIRNLKDCSLKNYLLEKPDTAGWDTHAAEKGEKAPETK